jgi:hypothetical protein
LKITNRLGLPQALVDAISNDDYDRGRADISVTQLLSPPRQVALLERHADELEEDASDLLYRLFGQIGHGILERANKVDLVERRYYMTVNDWVVSGKFDTLTLDDTAVLSDYKFSTVWKAKSGECPPEFEAQINVLAELLTVNNVTVKSGRIYLLLRDWSKTEAARDPSYPQQQIVPYDLRLWAQEDRADFIQRRVAAHQAARASLPDCSDSDRWMRSAKYAVMKEGRVRAVKLFDSAGMAEAWIAGQKDSRFLYVEHRPSEPTRCKFYCGAAAFCTQYQDFQAAQSGSRDSVAVIADDEVL